MTCLSTQKRQGAIYLSVEDVVEELGNTLQVKNLGYSLPVSFVSETETATIGFQLERLQKLHESWVSRISFPCAKAPAA